MRSFWFKSSYRKRIPKDLDFISSYLDGKYTDFDFASSFDNGGYFDFSFRSEYADFSGDFSIKSSYEDTTFGDFHFITSYLKSNTQGDFSLGSSIVIRKYVSFAKSMPLITNSRLDFTLISSIVKASYTDIGIKSGFNRDTYTDFRFQSSFLKLNAFYSIDFAFASEYKKQSINPYPRIINLNGFLLNEVFFGHIFSRNLAGAIYNIGALSLTFNNEYNTIYSENLELEYHGEIDLTQVLQSFGKMHFFEKKSFNLFESAELNLSVEMQPFSDVISNGIYFSYENKIYDLYDSTPSMIDMDIHVKELDIGYKENFINVRFEPEQVLIDGSKYNKIITVPAREAEIDTSKLLVNMPTYFKVDFKTSIYTVYEKNIFYKFGFDLVAKAKDKFIRGLINEGISLPSANTKKVLLSDAHYLATSKRVLDYSKIEHNTDFNKTGITTVQNRDYEYRSTLKFYPLNKNKVEVDNYALVEGKKLGGLIDPTKYGTFYNFYNKNIETGVTVFSKYSQAQKKVTLIPTNAIAFDNAPLYSNNINFEYSKLINLSKIISSFEFVINATYYPLVDFYPFYSNPLRGLSPTFGYADVYAPGSLLYLDKVNTDGVMGKAQSFIAIIHFTLPDMLFDFGYLKVANNV